MSFCSSCAQSQELGRSAIISRSFGRQCLVRALVHKDTEKNSEMSVEELKSPVDL